MAKRVILIIGTILIVCTIVGGYLWWRPPTVFDFPDARVTYKKGGTHFAITFIVQDTNGKPIEGVRVRTDSYSGWTQSETTDETGRAVVQPAETEVTAVEIDGRVAHLMPETMRHHDMFIYCIEEALFLPYCTGGGLTINAELAAK